MGIIWGILAATFVAQLYSAFNYKPGYYSSATRVVNYVAGKDYGQIYGTLHYDLLDNLDTEKQSEYKEVLAIHDYLEAAAQYKMYHEAGYTELAERHLARMNEAKTRLGELDFTAEDIDKILKNK